MWFLYNGNVDIIYNNDQAKKYVSFESNSYSWNFIEKPISEKYLKRIVNKDTKIMDAGCGSDRLTKVLLKLGAKPQNITGVDISPTLLEQARKKLPEVKFIEDDLARLTASKNSFDLIASNMVFHHLSSRDFAGVITKFSKALKKNGFLFYTTLHPLRFEHDRTRYHEDKPKTEKTSWGTEVTYYHKTFNDYLGELLNNGFNIIALEEPIPLGKKARENMRKFRKHSYQPTRLVVLAQKK